MRNQCVQCRRRNKLIQIVCINYAHIWNSYTFFVYYFYTLKASFKVLLIHWFFLLLSSRYKIAHATWEHRSLRTLTLQTTCPRAFLCSQLAMTCSIWTRSKKSSCKGSGMSWLKSIESRILKIFLRTGNVNQCKLYSEISRGKQKKLTIGA